MKDLKSVQFVHVPKYAAGDAIHFDLLRRAKHVNCLEVCGPNLDASAVDDSLFDDELPIWGDRHSVFNRLMTTYDLGEIHRREAQELEEAIRLADSSREDSLEFLLASKEQLDAQAKLLEPVIDAQKAAYAHRLAQHITVRRNATATEDDHYFFYQCSDGQQLFLHPINIKWLVLEYGSHGKFPFQLESRILDMEDVTQSDATRKRYKYLGHLPVTCEFRFILVDLNHILTVPENKAGFKEDVKTRADAIRERRVESERRQRATAKKPADPYRVAMEYHFAPPAAALEDQFDLDSAVAFPSVGGAPAASTTPVQPGEQPKGTVWASGPSKLVKNPVDEYPALPGVTESGPAIVPKIPVWGKQPTAVPAPIVEQQKPTQPAPSQGNGRRKKKMLVLMSN